MRAANDVVANAHPEDVELAAGNGPPHLVEKVRAKLAKHALATAGGSFVAGAIAGAGAKPLYNRFSPTVKGWATTGLGGIKSRFGYK